MPHPLSVIVPTYNRIALLRQTVEAILAQTRRPDEVIVIDDGSTDETEAAMATFGAAIVYRRVANGGVVRARMRGLEIARHEWIALCDSDDLWQPEHVARALALHAAAPEINMSFANFRILGQDGVSENTKFDTAPPGFWDRHVVRRLPEGWLIGNNYLEGSFRFTPIFPTALMFTKTLLARAGGMDVSRTGNRAEDGDFICRCLLTATVGAVPEATVLIRKYEGNISRDTMLGLLDEVDNLIHLRDTRPEFAPFHPTMNDEIRIRRIQAAEKAFAARNHQLVRAILRQIPPRQRPLKLQIKHAVAQVPEPLSLYLNSLLQATAERIK